MHNGIRSCAAAAALFLLTPVLRAQDPTLAAHLAAAKIAESRGELAAAEKELLDALAVARDADRPQVTQALQALRVKMGKDTGEAPVPGGGGGDPVARCIQALDAPEDAGGIDSLRRLGSLVVPQLLASLPRLGPFGVRNAVTLLGFTDDERVREALMGAIDANDVDKIAAIGQALENMVPGLSLPLAEKLAAADVGVRELLAALKVLLRLDPERGGAEVVAMRLATPERAMAHGELLGALDSARPAWQRSVLAALWEHGSGATRAEVLRQRIATDTTFGEERCLKDLATLDRGLWWSATYGAAGARPEWLHVATRVLAAVADVGPKDKVAGIVGTWEWWRQPDVVAETLVSPAVLRSNANAAWDACTRMIREGWRIPAALEDVLAGLAESHSGGWSWFVGGLPVDGEVRAMALADRLSAGARPRFVEQVARAGRPWHRLIARQLAAVTKAGDIDTSLLGIDWTGVGPEAVADLVTFARRYPSLPGSGPQCDGLMLHAFALQRALPPEFVIPLVESGSLDAWDVLAGREPAAALAWAARTERMTDSIAERAYHLLIRSGGDADLPLAVRLCRMGVFPGDGGGENLVNFVGAHGAGALDAIRLGAMPLPADGFTARWCITAAGKAAEGARVADLPALLALLPRLQGFVAGVVLEQLTQGELGAAHTSALAAALDPLLGPALVETSTSFDDGERRTFGDGNLVRHLCGLLGQTGDAAAEPVLRRGVERCRGSFAAAAAGAALAVTADRPRLLADLLTSSEPHVVAVALGASETAADADLRARATAAVLRLRGLVDQIGPFARHLAPEDGIAWAVAVLENPDLAQLGWALVEPALQLLGSRKDAKFLPDLLRAAAHPSETVRLQLARQLGNTFSREAAPHLIEMLKDDSGNVRKAAQTALDQIANYLDQRETWEKRFGK